MALTGRRWTWDKVLTGVVPPVISVLESTGGIDQALHNALCEHILSDGGTGLFVLGGCGEGAWLTSDQRAAVVRHSVAASAGRAPVIAGVMLPATALAVDAVVLTTGMAAADFVRHVPGERDGLGRLKVERSLRAPEAPGIFVTGDAAAADTGTGNVALQSCQHALQLGRFAGENAARDLLGLPLVDYAQPRYVTCLDLGRTGAVFTEGWDRVVQKSGADAKAIKRSEEHTS